MAGERVWKSERPRDMPGNNVIMMGGNYEREKRARE